jgi:hypothetical protein
MPQRENSVAWPEGLAVRPTTLDDVKAAPRWEGEGLVAKGLGERPDRATLTVARE